MQLMQTQAAKVEAFEDHLIEKLGREKTLELLEPFMKREGEGIGAQLETIHRAMFLLHEAIEYGYADGHHAGYSNGYNTAITEK